MRKKEPRPSLHTKRDPNRKRDLRLHDEALPNDRSMAGEKKGKPMLGQFVTVGNIFAHSRSASGQIDGQDQYSASRGRLAENEHRQGQDNFQLTETPNEVAAGIGTENPRSPNGIDIIDIYNVHAGAEAESFESQGLSQEGIVARPEPGLRRISAEADNRGRMKQRNGQWVQADNHVTGRIDHPGFGPQGPVPVADLAADNITSDAAAKNTQLQDSAQSASVKKDHNVLGGVASNDVEQGQDSDQRARGRNYISLVRNLGGIFCPPAAGPAPRITNTYNNGTTDSFQAQSLNQAVKNCTPPGKPPQDSETLFMEVAENGQTVVSGDAPSLTPDQARLKLEQDLMNHLSAGYENGNEQGQVGSQFAESTGRGVSRNSGNQSQNSDQELGRPGRWVNIRA